mmetsp:Transcript_23685/g.61866  ORF Transcript_23685/g.61866 Transcript_23685/m.61866 type:complete len:413 (+) Transcript_23685:311-1549(+)
MPEACSTPDGFIRIRYDEKDGEVVHFDPARLTPRFVELPEGTPVDVCGYPVKNQRGPFWEIVKSDPEEQVYLVNKAGATDNSQEMWMDFKKVRQRPGDYSKVDHPEYFTSGEPSSKHPDYHLSAPYRRRMFAKKRREAQIASGSKPPRKRDDEEGYHNHPATKYNKQWAKDNAEHNKEVRANYEPYCCFCGRACNVSKCNCGGKGTGKVQLAHLVRRSLRLAITDALGGDLTDKNCRLLTGFPANEVVQILKAAIPDDVNIEDLLEKKCEQRGFKYPACVIHKDHIKAVSQWLHELDQEPGWNPDKTPNDALRLINRIENLQYLIWWANLKKGADYTDAIRKDLAEYEKCFYSAAQLKKSDVLRRKYLSFSTVLVKVKAWAAARGGARGAWRPIGVPSRSHSGAEVRKLMAL